MCITRLLVTVVEKHSSHSDCRQLRLCKQVLLGNTLAAPLLGQSDISIFVHAYIKIKRANSYLLGISVRYCNTDSPSSVSVTLLSFVSFFSYRPGTDQSTRPASINTRIT
jgi:hypothetical protein